jgi:MOSC domain-containing protein YiiM
MDTPNTTLSGVVLSVSLRPGHRFSKALAPEIRLVAGLGIEGDGHFGETVQHRSRVRDDPSQPNLRQAHLIHAELFDELADKGFAVAAGDLGENITTRGIDLLALPAGAVLRIGADARIELTGLRNPCRQIEAFQSGLVAAVLERTTDGRLIRKAGVMGVIVSGGVVRAGDAIDVDLPPSPHRPLEPV